MQRVVFKNKNAKLTRSTVIVGSYRLDVFVPVVVFCFFL